MAAFDEKEAEETRRDENMKREMACIITPRWRLLSYHPRHYLRTKSQSHVLFTFFIESKLASTGTGRRPSPTQRKQLRRDP